MSVIGGHRTGDFVQLEGCIPIAGGFAGTYEN